MAHSRIRAQFGQHESDQQKPDAQKRQQRYNVGNFHATSIDQTRILNGDTLIHDHDKTVLDPDTVRLRGNNSELKPDRVRADGNRFFSNPGGGRSSSEDIDDIDPGRDGSQVRIGLLLKNVRFIGIDRENVIADFLQEKGDPVTGSLRPGR